MSRLGALVIALLGLIALVATGCNQNTAPPSSTGSTPLKITTSNLVDGRTGLNYSQTLQANGGKVPYVWSISSGSLPDGVHFSANNGIISGIPQKAGTFEFSAEVKDSLGSSSSQKYSITIKAASQPLTSGTGSLPDAEVNVAYSKPLKAFGGDGKYIWSISNGTLPDGLVLDASGGSISGTPKTDGTGYFTIKVVDGAGSIATEALTIAVKKTLNILSTEIAAGEVGMLYSQSADAADGVPNYVWIVSEGVLPDGLKMDPNSGNISGTPTKAGTFKLTLQLKDTAGGTATLETSIIIYDPVTLTTTSLPDGTVGASYSQAFAYKDGDGTVIWAQAGGTLPDGLSFDGNTGIISGTPKTAGAFNFSIQVIDSLGAASTQDFALQIK